MKPETKTKLDALIGQSLMYNQLVIKFKEWKAFPSGTVVVVSDLKTFNLHPNELEAFFNSLYPVDPNVMVQQPDSDKRQFPKVEKQIAPVEVSIEKKEEIIFSLTAEQSISNVAQIISNPVSESETIKTNLMAMMEKVMADPRAIPQAKSIV